MPPSSPRIALRCLALTTLLGFAAPSAATRDLAHRSGSSCTPQWLATFGGVQGLDGTVEALAVFDDGSGAALYAGGRLESAGGQPASRVARWDGNAWSPLGSGVDGGPFPRIASLAVFDDGSGAALYAGGAFTGAGGAPASHIAKWDGNSWSPLGSGVNGVVRALAVFDDGSGTALYAGGAFTGAGGAPASHIAKWDGASWSPLGGGTGGEVHALAVFDDGTGAALYAGGWFSSAGGVAASMIARWDGSAWSPLGSGLGGGESPPIVEALAVYDDGSGAALYAGGWFNSAGGQPAGRIARWDGGTWSALGNGMDVLFNAWVRTLAVFDDGSGAALYAGGRFEYAGDQAANNIAKWDGSAWSPLAGGLDGEVGALTAFDGGSGPGLFAGGDFTGAGGPHYVAAWDGSTFSSLGGRNGLDSSVRALVVHDDGSGAALFAGGSFTGAGGQPASFIAKWHGNGWSPLGRGLNGLVRTLAVFDDGSGAALFAGGDFTSAGGQPAGFVAKWDGRTWSPLGAGTSQSVHALTVFDDGSGAALHAGGFFASAGGVPASGLAKWDGNAWSPLGTGSGANGIVRALGVFDDGSGPALYAGGAFTAVDGQAANRIARWDGSSWSPLGSGVNSTVLALRSFDDGAGAALYAAGSFTVAGSQPASRIAKWDGNAWSSLGSGASFYVEALAVHDDGSGPGLYAGGSFTSAGGLPALRIARWDGSAFSPLGSGVSAPVLALQGFDAGSGAALYVGGEFAVSPAGDSYLARWGCESPPVTLFCGGDGSGPACPCANANDGSLGVAGCASSAFASGCRITASGSYPDAVTILAENAARDGFAIAVRGTGALQPAVPRFDGLLCIGGNTWRSPAFAIDSYGRAESAPLPPGPAGVPWYYQLWYRDPGQCAGSNLSNALGITW